MSITGSGFRRDLPENEFLAATNSATQATAANPFVTVNDLPAGGDGIYDGSGSVPTATVATLTDTFTFNSAIAGGQVIIDSGVIAASLEVGLIVKRNTSAGAAIQVGHGGGVGSSGNARLIIDKGGATAFSGLEFRKAGVAAWAIGNTATHDGTLTFATDVAGNSPKMSISAAGNMLISTATTFAATAKLQIRGNGTTVNENILLEDSSGVNRFWQSDNGEFAIGANVAAPALSATYSGQISLTGKTYGLSITGRNNSVASVIVNPTGTTPTGIYVPFQTSLAGTTIGIRAFNLNAAGATTIGLQGQARNGSSVSIGTEGTIGGGAVVVPSAYVAGIRGTAAYNLDALSYGGYFTSAPGAPANADAKDKIAVFGFATNNTNASGSTSKAVGAMYSTSTSGGGGSAVNMAINVPSTANDGVVVYGADVRSGDRILQLTGGAVFFGNGTGFDMYQPNGILRTITLNNSGALVIT